MKIFPDYEDASLTPEELAEATQNMERALSERDENGRIWPIDPIGPGEFADTIGRLFFPMSTDSGRVIWHVQEFAHGQIPADLYYAPGRKIWISSPNGGYWKIVFDNPVLNLSPMDQYLLQQAQNVPPPLLQPVHQASPLPPGITPPRTVWAIPQGMALETAEGGELLSNFQVRAIQRCLIVTRGESNREEFTLEVTCGGVSRNLTVTSTDLETLAPIIARKFPACYVEADASKASQRIANVIRSQIPLLPTVTVIRSPGFINLGGKWVYAHDGATFDGLVEFKTGYTIPCDSRISPQQAFHAALGVLELAEKSPTMLALLLVSHLGPLYQLFESAGIPPRFVTFLEGQTGSFKTSLALVLFRLFLEMPKTPEASFRDTKAALDVKLGDAGGRVFLVDDWQPAVTSTAGRENLDKLEQILRLFGDGIAKARSNSELGRAKEFKPAGACVITGENTGGSHSSLLRCLILSIGKGEVDGKKLKFFQDRPELLPTHHFHFLSWCGANGDLIVDFLKQEFQPEREFFSAYIKESRQVDTAAILMLTARILLRYSQVASPALSETGIGNIQADWRDAIITLLCHSEEESKDLDPVWMYVKALLESQAVGKFSVAPTQSAFKPGHHIGFIKNGDWWLFPKEAYTTVVRYWRDEGTLFPLKAEKVHARLHEKRLIEISRENRKGREKTLYTKKSTLEGRPRMLVLRVEQAREYIENNS